MKVDELAGEQEMLREEITVLKVQRERTRARISELEDEVKRLREVAAAAEAKSDPADEEQDIPMAQRKRFTRVEMARVLLERNQYKVEDTIFFIQICFKTKHQYAQYLRILFHCLKYQLFAWGTNDVL